MQGVTQEMDQHFVVQAALEKTMSGFDTEEERANAELVLFFFFFFFFSVGSFSTCFYFFSSNFLGIPIFADLLTRADIKFKLDIAKQLVGS